MPHNFQPAEIDDCDGSTTRVTIGTDTDWRACVVLTNRADETFEAARAYLDPAGARAVAAALLEAADEADERQLAADVNEQDLADAIADMRAGRADA